MSPAPEFFANELAVGAKSLEDVVENLELVREATEDDPPPKTFLDPMLPMVPCADTRVAVESLLPMDETFVLLVLDRVVRVVPTTEPAREGGLAIELVRLVRVPPLTKEAVLLCRLFLLELVLKEGMGDRDREEDAIEPLVVVAADTPFSSGFCFRLLTRMAGTALPLATAVVGRAGAGAAFLAGRREGGPIFSFPFGVSSLIMCDGLGMLLGAAFVASFPRFHTLCTRVLADEKNPNLEGFGLGFTGGRDQN